MANQLDITVLLMTDDS